MVQLILFSIFLIVSSLTEIRHTYANGLAHSSSYNGVASTFDRINLRSIHEMGYQGRGCIVAVFDDGINFSKPTLAGKQVQGGKIILGPDFMIEAPELYREGGHGTEMAKILAGRLDGEGRAGVAPEVQLIPYSDTHGGTFLYAIQDAMNRGAQIINFSLQEVTLDLLFRELEGLEAEQVLGASAMASQMERVAVVVIAGNGGEGTATPMESDHKSPFDSPYGNLIVTVAIDEANHLTLESHRCGSTQKFCLAIPSPGPTSPTAPIVSGILALLMEASPGHPMSFYVEALLETARPLASPEETGRGIPDAAAALERVLGF